MKLKLEKSKHVITLLDELTGEIAIEMEKSYRSSINLEQILEEQKKGFRNKSLEERAKATKMNFSKDKKVLMEFAHLMITEVKTEGGKTLEPSLEFVKSLPFSDFKLLENEVKKLTEDVDFF